MIANNASDDNLRCHATPVAETLERLKVDAGRGLDIEEAQRRLEHHGKNALLQTRTRSAGAVLVEQFKSMVIIVLMIAGSIAFAFGHLAEGIAIAAVLVVNTAIGFFTEWKAVRAMATLRAVSDPRVRVRRGGNVRGVAVERLVPGDVILIESGDIAPADARLIEANNLQVDESALTGESVPVRKQVDPVADDAPLAERASMLFKGTTTTKGSGAAVVAATGMQTELGKISEMTARASSDATPLQKRLDRLGRNLAWITLATALVIAVIGLMAGQDPLRMIETAIALGVAAIPEGLPIVATIALARGMVLMARRNVLIRRLPAVETLGATQVIFTDKTGTLTENRMTLHRVRLAGQTVTLEDEQGARTGQTDPLLLKRIIEVGVLCNNASLDDEGAENSGASVQGDPTEMALLRAGRKMGLDRSELLEAKPEEREVAFDPDKMMMATYHRGPEGLEVAVKGAPSRVIEACATVAGDGEKLDAAGRRRWAGQAEALADEGLRVLALADKSVDHAKAEPYEALRLLGLVGLLDPAREGVRESIQECRGAGIRVIMATGDLPATATAIARQTGIVETDAPRVMHGNDLLDPERMRDEMRRRTLETAVFARVSPRQKLRLVTLMQSAGKTVAMTGDGINDAPALKKADIGVAMGRRGTDAARDVADMVLRDDAFSSIVAAVHQGRIIFANIRKSVMFMLCTNLAEVIAVVAASVAGGFSGLPLPLNPLQILYLNVITDVFPALALAIGPGSEGIMEQPPRPRDESVLTGGHWKAVAGWAVLIAVCVLAALLIAFYPMGADRHGAVTVSFLTLAFGKLWFVFNLRHPQSGLLDNEIVRNPYIAGSIVLCAGLLVAAIYLPGLSGLLRTAPPGAAGWLLILIVSLVPFGWGQIWRCIRP